jgi:ABC-type transporter Mla MlaB component
MQLGGEIDVYTAPRLREAIVAAINAGHTQLVVDVEKVDFLDSTGLGVLVGALKKVRADGGTLDIVCTQERPSPHTTRRSGAESAGHRIGLLAPPRCHERHGGLVTFSR